MKLEKYTEQQALLPQTGKRIIANHDAQCLTVYQAFNPAIAAYAVKNQRFGGNHYSFQRMTWIKPNFMWMMFRAGWATKPNQERILAIKMTIEGFDTILLNATKSSFDAQLYENREVWKAALANTEVRLQWDPDHDPIGGKLERKAIQLGMKGNILEQFNEEWITEITDITDFVSQQKENATGNFENLLVPIERAMTYDDKAAVGTRIGLDVDL